MTGPEAFPEAFEEDWTIDEAGTVAFSEIGEDGSVAWWRRCRDEEMTRTEPGAENVTMADLPE